MAIQYLYPISDYQRGSAYNQSNSASPLYSSIDEGVSTPNDSDFIHFSGGVGTGSAYFFLTDSVNVKPSSVIFNFRAKAYSVGNITCGLFDEVGLVSEFGITDPIVVSSTSFSNYSKQINIPSFNRNIVNPKLYIVEAGSYRQISISSAEVILSGVYTSNNDTNLSTPGNVNLISDSLHLFDLEESAAYYNNGDADDNNALLYYSNDAKSLNPKSSQFLPSGLFNVAYFPISGQPVNNVIYAEYTNKSGIIGTNEGFKHIFRNSNGESPYVGYNYSRQDNYILTSGTSNSTFIDFDNVLNSGDFTVYLRFIHNYSSSPGGELRLRSDDNSFDASIIINPTTNYIQAMLLDSGSNYKIVTTGSPAYRKTNGAIITYSSGNGLGIFWCHTNGYVSSGTYSTPFQRYVPPPESGHVRLIDNLNGYQTGHSEIGFSNRDLSSNVSDIQDCYYQLADRISRDVTTTPSSNDYSIVHKINHKNSSSNSQYKDLAIFGYPVRASGVSRGFYDIAHCQPTSYLTYTEDDRPRYVYQHPDDSGVLVWKFHYEIDTNCPSGITAVAKLKSMDTSGNIVTTAYAPAEQLEPTFIWQSDRINLHSGGIRYAEASGYFASNNPKVLVGNKINQTLFYPEIRVPSGEFFTTFKIYSSAIDLIGWETIPTGVFNNTTLYIKGQTAYSSGTTLYINGNIQREMPLYISGPTVYSGNKSTTLFIRTQYGQSGVPTSGTTLFIRNFVENSGNLPLVITGPSSSTVTSNAPLYISGPVVYSGDNLSLLKPVSLFLGNYAGSGNKSTTLFLSNKSESSGNYPLYIEGGGTDTRNGSTTLFVKSYYNSSGNIPLYIPGGVNEAFVNLSVAGKNIDAMSGNTTLFIDATSESGLTKFTTMYLEGNGHSQYAPLFMKADTTGENFDNITLYLNNDNTSSKDTTLFIKNLGGTSNSGTRLFVKGDGVNNNFYAVNGSMPMFINRGNDSVSRSVNLFLESVKLNSGETTLFIDGTRGTNSGTTLAIPNVASPKTNNTSMYTHGY